MSFVIGHVRSADTFVLWPASSLSGTGPREERLVSLAGIEAPRCSVLRPSATAGTSEPEGPWGFPAREWARRRWLRQQCTFEPAGGAFAEGTRRTLGTLSVRLGDKTEDAALALVTAGFARPRGKASAEMQGAEEAAKKGGAGMNGPPPATRTLRWTFSTAGPSLIPAVGSKVRFLVESVGLNGTQVRGFLLPAEKPGAAPGEHLWASLVFSGVRPAPQSEAAVAQARIFTENALLGRLVHVQIDAVQADRDSFVGSVLPPDASAAPVPFQVGLVARGLAKAAPETAATPAGATGPKLGDLLKAAEAKAQSGKVGLWHSWVAPPPAPAGAAAAEAPCGEGMTAPGSEWTGRVVGVPSGDSLIVQPPGGGAPIRLILAGVKVPRETRPPPRGAAAPPVVVVEYPPGAVEAREVLRRAAIGQDVAVRIDRTLPAREGGAPAGPAQVRCMGDATLKCGSAAAMLLKAGWAELDVRGTAPPELAAAAEAAKAAGAGLRGKVPPGKSIREHGRGAVGKGAELLAQLKRGGAARGATAPRLPAVVEAVLSPTRYRVFVEREAAVLTISLPGVVAPQTARPGADGERGTGGEDDPLAYEALEWAKAALLHRDVVVEAESTDRAGGVVANVFFRGGPPPRPGGDPKSDPSPTGEAAEAVAVNLVWHGLGVCSTSAAGRGARLAAAIKDAEAAARGNKRGVWAPGKRVPRARAEMDERDAQRGAGGSGEVEAVAEPLAWEDVDVVWADVSGAAVWTHARTKSAAASLAAVTSALAGVSFTSGTPPTAEQRRGTLVAAEFEDDKAAYRARVMRVVGGAGGEAKAVVEFVDFGNTAEVPLSSLRPLPASLCGAGAPPPLARRYPLAFVSLPSGGADPTAAGLCADAIAAFCASGAAVAPATTCGGVTAYLVVPAGGAKPSTLAPAVAASLQASLAEAGLARVRGVPAASAAALESVKASEAASRKANRGMFRTGAALDEDDD